jgi:hypothetical protein
MERDLSDFANGTVIGGGIDAVHSPPELCDLSAHFSLAIRALADSEREHLEQYDL